MVLTDRVSAILQSRRINSEYQIVSHVSLNDRIVSGVLLQTVEDIPLQEESLLSAHADDVPVEGGPGAPDLRSQD